MWRESEKQDRRGGERYSRESSEARQIQWRNPPSSQINIAASLPPPSSPPPPVSITVFFPPPFLTSPLFISALRVPSSQLQLLLLQPIHRALLDLLLPSPPFTHSLLG